MTGAKPARLVVLDPISPETAARLRSLLPPELELHQGTSRDEAHQCAVIADADFAISGQIAVNGTVLRAARRLRLLHKWGVGVDNIDLAAARALGIVVARTTGSNAVPVAEFTVGLILSALRGLAYGHGRLQEGEWAGGRMPHPAASLSGKTVGIVGYGAIGQTVGRIVGAGFGCTVLYTKAAPAPGIPGRHVTLPELLAQSDVVTLHCPLTPATAGMIDAAALRAMKPTAVLVNTARGPLVVEADLRAALKDGTITAAAMDVFDEEPLPADNPLRGIPNLTITPHIAAASADTFRPTVERMYANMLRVLRGEPLPPGDVVA